MELICPPLPDTASKMAWKFSKNSTMRISNLDYNHKNALHKNKAMITVINPETPIAIPPMAPCISPISIAFEVPAAWLQVPMATPAATELFMRKIFTKTGDKAAPNAHVR